MRAEAKAETRAEAQVNAVEAENGAKKQNRDWVFTRNRKLKGSRQDEP